MNAFKSGNKSPKGSLISRIAKLNQFVMSKKIGDIEKELKNSLDGNPAKVDTGVYVNLTNGSKVQEHIIEASKGMFSDKTPFVGLVVTWTVNYNVSSKEHQSYFFGEDAERYIALMEQESSRIRGPRRLGSVELD